MTLKEFADLAEKRGAKGPDAVFSLVDELADEGKIPTVVFQPSIREMWDHIVGRDFAGDYKAADATYEQYGDEEGKCDAIERQFKSASKK